MVPMLYVFALVAAFGAFWLVVAALQTFTDAQPARMDNIIGAVVCAAVSAGLIWLARWYRRASQQEDATNVRMEDGHGLSAKG